MLNPNNYHKDDNKPIRDRTVAPEYAILLLKNANISLEKFCKDEKISNRTFLSFLNHELAEKTENDILSKITKSLNITMKEFNLGIPYPHAKSRWLRLAMDMTVEDLSQKSGVPEETIELFEAGQKIPTRDICMLAFTLGTTCSVLTGNDRLGLTTSLIVQNPTYRVYGHIQSGWFSMENFPLCIHLSLTLSGVYLIQEMQGQPLMMIPSLNNTLFIINQASLQEIVFSDDMENDESIQFPPIFYEQANTFFRAIESVWDTLSTSEDDQWIRKDLFEMTLQEKAPDMPAKLFYRMLEMMQGYSECTENAGTSDEVSYIWMKNPYVLKDEDEEFERIGRQMLDKKPQEYENPLWEALSDMLNSAALDGVNCEDSEYPDDVEYPEYEDEYEDEPEDEYEDESKKIDEKTYFAGNRIALRHATNDVVIFMKDGTIRTYSPQVLENPSVMRSNLREVIDSLVLFLCSDENWADFVIKPNFAEMADAQVRRLQNGKMKFLSFMDKTGNFTFLNWDHIAAINIPVSAFQSTNAPM